MTLCSTFATIPIMQKVLILHNIRSTHNVGAIFRTSDAIGIDTIYVSGYTPRPLDRFGRPVKALHKSAVGAEMFVDWKSVKIPGVLIKKLKKEGFYCIGLEQDRKSVDYKKINLLKKEKVAVLVGNEVRGISKQLRERCDVIAEIPMKGEKESLNVSTATGILLFRLFDR